MKKTILLAHHIVEITLPLAKKRNLLYRANVPKAHCKKSLAYTIATDRPCPLIDRAIVHGGVCGGGARDEGARARLHRVGQRRTHLVRRHHAVGDRT